MWKTNTKTWPHSQFLAEDLQSFWNARTSQSSTNMVNNLLKWLDTSTPKYKTLPRQIPITINYLTASSSSSKLPNTLRNNRQIKKIHSIVISFISTIVNNWIDNKITLTSDLKLLQIIPDGEYWPKQHFYSHCTAKCRKCILLTWGQI